MMTNDKRRIVGHKTFYDPKKGYSHKPLFEDEAKALLAAVDAAKKRRAKIMPTERAAIEMMFQAWQRLQEFGWSEAMYCPKDGSHFKVIEAGSTGIFDCVYQGEWPDGHYLIADQGDVYFSRPIMFKKTKTIRTPKGDS